MQARRSGHLFCGVIASKGDEAIRAGFRNWIVSLRSQRRKGAHVSEPVGAAGIGDQLATPRLSGAGWIDEVAVVRHDGERWDAASRNPDHAIRRSLDQRAREGIVSAGLGRRHALGAMVIQHFWSRPASASSALNGG